MHCNLNLKPGCFLKTTNRKICFLNSNNQSNVELLFQLTSIEKMIRNYSANSIELSQEITDLRRKIENLESENQMKDLKLKNMLCDNQKLAIKVKKLQRCNRNLQKQLDDERNFYEKEKERLREEVQGRSKKCNVSKSLLHLRHQRELERMCEALQEENKKLHEEIVDHNEITYDLYNKFQKLKDRRDILRQKLNQLFQNYLHVLEVMMKKLDEAREELNSLVSTQFKNMPLEKTKYIQVIRKNRELNFQNAVYNLEIHQLKHSLAEAKCKLKQLKTSSEDNQSTDSSNTSRTQRSQILKKNSWYCEYPEKSSTNNSLNNKQSDLRIIKNSSSRQTEICENCNASISSDLTKSENDIKTCDDGASADESSGS